MLPIHASVKSAIALLTSLVTVSLPLLPVQALSEPGSERFAPHAQTQQWAQKPNTLSDLEPEIGMIRQIQPGDLMCYITFVDELGKTRRVGATFELCENPRQYLNQRARLVYGIRSVSDCQSAEPCGKSRRTHLVIRMDRVNGSERTVSTTNSVVLRNRDWTIAVGNRNSWSGVNGTGNLSYRGCNTKGQCLNLAGGKVTCRHGMCATIWRNGVYSYTLTSPMFEGNRAPSALIVRQNDNVLQEITGLR